MKDLERLDAYILSSREVEDIIDEIVGIPLYPGYSWRLWEFHISQRMSNDTCIKVDLGNEDYFDDYDFIELMQWCEKMHKANAYLQEHISDIEAYKNFKHGDGTKSEEFYSLSNKMDKLMQHLRSIGVEDRPEDHMGICLLRALQYGKIIPAGIYIIEVSW